MIRANVLIITPDPSDALTCDLRRILSDRPDISVRVEQAQDDAVTSKSNADYIEKTQIDIVFIVTSRAHLLSFANIVSSVKKKKSGMPIVIVNDTETPEDIMVYFTASVSDYISAPLRAVDILPRMWRLIAFNKEQRTVIQRLKSQIGLKQLIGRSPAFCKVVEKIPVIAQSDVSVLITGETGTGKEMCARAIHYLGPRTGWPFVPVNCGAIPVELIENELFGHAKGAFTSAVTSQDGIISEADGGTLFLDEIDCLPLAAQVKLLRFLQDREYRQLGSSRTKRADVRIIAATNIDLDLAVNECRFRRDLYYRLNIIPLALPPLRERRDDVPMLAEYFAAKYAGELNKDLDGIAPEAMQKLLVYDWPGNVRELQNVIERAVVFSFSPVLQKEDLSLPRREMPSPLESFQQAKARVVVEFEKKYIHCLLVSHHGNITHAARTAGKNRRAFWELMRKHEIDVNQFRISD